MPAIDRTPSTYPMEIPMPYGSRAEIILALVAASREEPVLDEVKVARYNAAWRDVHRVFYGAESRLHDVTELKFIRNMGVDDCIVCAYAVSGWVFVVVI